MRIIIFADMEGCSGICLRSQVESKAERYFEGRKYMTMDINACIKGCFNGGAEKVVVRDVHATCCNIIWEDIDERAECILGIPGAQRFDGIEEYDGLILLGYHAMAGTPGAILEHTGSKTWQNCWINGKKVGEIALDASRAGEHGVPVIMVSGDDKACAEAKSFLCGLETVQVKSGIHLEGGKMLSPLSTHTAIAVGAEKAVKNYKAAEIFTIKTPATIKIELIERQQISVPCYKKDPNNSRSFETVASTIEEALSYF